MSHREARTARSDGLTTWRSRQQLIRARRRTRWLASGFLLLSLLWLTAFASGPVSILGVVILEVFTTTPVVLAVVHSHKLSTQLKQADLESADEQTAEVVARRDGEEKIWRLKQLVDSLESGPAREAGQDALRSVRGTLEVHNDLVHRVTQLKSLVALTREPEACQQVRVSLQACEGQLAGVDGALDHLTGALTTFVAAAGPGQLGGELDELRDATDRMTALTEGFTEVQGLSRAALSRDPGPGTDEPPNQR